MAPTNNDIIINVRVEMLKAKKELKEAQNHIKGLKRVSDKSLKSVAEAEQKVLKQTKKLNKVLGKNEFAGWALSLMFFGMALKRTFDTIWKGSTKMFQDISHSVEGTVTGFDLLNGSLDYLKFTVGQALEPIAAMLAPIIEMVADWVSRHQGLVATIITIVGVVGTLLTTFAMLKLAADGFASALSLMSVGKITGLGSLASLLTTPVGAGVLAALAALAALGVLSWKAFKETPEAWNSVLKSAFDLKKPLESLRKDISELTQDMFGFQVQWELIGWTLAWVAELFKNKIKNDFIYPLSNLTNAIGVVINAITAMKEAWKDPFEAKKALERAKRDLEDIKNTTFDKAKTSVRSAELLRMGPLGFQRERQEENRQQQLIVNIGTYNAQIEAGRDELDALNRAIEIHAPNLVR